MYSQDKLRGSRGFVPCSPAPSREKDSSYRQTGRIKRRAGERTSDRLTDEQVIEATAAATHALAIGKPLNRFITINWEASGVVDVQAATRSFLKALSDYARRHGLPSAYVWTVENGSQTGLHVHILLHLDPRLARDVRRLQRGWLKKAGAAWRKGLIRSEPLGKRMVTAASIADPKTRQAYLLNFKRVLAYVLKNSSFEMYSRLGRQFNPKSGSVAGQRSGISRNLGPAQRRARCSVAQALTS